MNNPPPTAEDISEFITDKKRKCKCGAYFVPIAADEALCYDCQCEHEWQKSQYEFATSKRERKVDNE